MTNRIRTRKTLLITVSILIGLSGGVLIFNGCFSFRPEEMQSSPQYSGTLSPETTFSLISFNTWRLCEPERVPALVQALMAIGDDLDVASENPILPDILLFQELECLEATDRLRSLLEPTHWFDTNVCALKRSGEPRSVVGIAVNRARFEVVEEQMIDLGQLFPDHDRCALIVKIRSYQHQKYLYLVSVHHSPHPLKYFQTKQMLAQFENMGLLEAERVIVGGDFNFTTRSRSYRLMTSVLTDPFSANRGKTHWIGGRIDFIFTNRGLSLLRPLDRKNAYYAIKPAGLFRTIYPCPEQDRFECPVSDHLPEGGLFTFQES